MLILPCHRLSVVVLACHPQLVFLTRNSIWPDCQALEFTPGRWLIVIIRELCVPLFFATAIHTPYYCLPFLALSVTLVHSP
jgi:hypothetical protein